MDRAFRNSVVASALIHAYIISAGFYSVSNVIKEIERKPAVVNYIRIREPAPRTEDTPQVAIPQRVEVARTPAPRPDDAQKEEDRREAPQDPARRQARLKSSKAYINYFQLIREKIRARLKANYTDYRSEGDVKLAFAVYPDGSLAAVDVEKNASTNDSMLQDMAITSVREAAPFHAFPDGLSSDKMSFDLVVTFKKR